MAAHIAHLFVRDPLVLFEGRIEELDDAEAMDHFENIQSTNWQTVSPPTGKQRRRSRAVSKPPSPPADLAALLPSLRPRAARLR